MIVQLKESADFLTRYWRVVLDIYHRPQRILTETELYQTVDQIKGALLTEDSDYLIKRMLQLKIVTRGVGEDAAFELAPALRSWIDFLLEHAEPVSEDSIRAHHLNLEKLIHDLRDAFEKNDHETGRIVVQELTTLFRRFTQDISVTHTAVLKETQEVKSARDRMNSQEKFVRINRLYHRYVEPIRRIVSVHGEMEATFDELEHLALRSVAAAFFRDPTVSDHILHQVSHARLIARTRLEECAREVEPLFRRLRRETRILTGASRCLTLIQRHGLKRSGVLEKFPLVSFRVLRQYRDGLLTHLLAQVLASNPAQAPVITAEGGGQIEEGERRAAALLKEINESLDLLLPVDDLLGALHDRFPNEPGAALMDAFSDIVLNPDHVSVFDESGPNRRQYSFEDVKIIANPAAVSVNL